MRGGGCGRGLKMMRKMTAEKEENNGEGKET